MDVVNSSLLTDLYELNMAQAYLGHGKTGTAVFEFFVRKLSATRGFLIAAGLEQALDFLETLQFTSEELEWLAETGVSEKASSTISRRCALQAMFMPCRRVRSFFLMSRSFA